ncbi:HTH_Tnp_Tc3_2 domain-containing protein [Trichonephila clavipes]|nr:HTH_Tnp_Tc3_2 domain-containing protein [Trichonephila clavipes]
MEKIDSGHEQPCCMIIRHVKNLLKCLFGLAAKILKKVLKFNFASSELRCFSLRRGIKLFAAIGAALKSDTSSWGISKVIRAHYEQLSEFERGRIIELKENRRIARHMDRSDAAIKNAGKNGENGRFQRHDVSGRPRSTADREDRLTDRLAVTVSDSLLSTIRRTTRTRVSTMTIHRRLMERNLFS